MNWYDISHTPTATAIFIVVGFAAIYFRRAIAGWIVRNDSSHVGRDAKYADVLRNSLAQWSVGIGGIFILNAIINMIRMLR